MMSAILPATVACAEIVGAMPDAALLPEERVALGRAVEKRQREFAAGRWLARCALERLGLEPAAIPRGSNREPIWPAGVVGSITHCRSYCAAAIAPASAIATIGIDAEPHEPLPRGVLGLVSRDEERQWIQARDGDAACWDRLLFSAKESVFKAWYPVMGCWLDFSAVNVLFNPGAATFQARFVGARPVVDGRALPDFEGRYVVTGPHVLTSVTVTKER